MNASGLSLTVRFWGALATGALLLVAAILLDRPVLLGGGAAVLGWVLFQQWRLVRAAARVTAAATVEQTIPPGPVTVDEAVQVTVSVTLPTTVDASVEVDLDLPVSATRTTDGPVVSLERGEWSASGETSLVWDVAGRYRLTDPVITLRDPDGLFVARTTVSDECPVRVDPPDVGPVDVGRDGRELLENAGNDSLAFRQHGPDFATLREYVVGDSRRHIDWRATARLGSLHVREFEVVQDLAIGFVVDTRTPMSAGPPGRTKLDYVRHLALSLHDGLCEQRLPVGLFVCGDDGTTVRVPPQQFSGKRARRVRDRLGEIHPTTGSEDRTTDANRRSETGRVRRHRASSDASRTAYTLGNEDSAFASRLRPFFAAAGRTRSQHDRADPLYGSVTEFRRRQSGPTVTYLFTDDTHRGSVAKAVQAAVRGDGEAVVFLTPSVLFDPALLSNPDAAYDRFTEFERFRRRLDAREGVTVYEVGPGDELETIVARRARARREQRERARTTVVSALADGGEG